MKRSLGKHLADSNSNLVYMVQGKILQKIQILAQKEQLCAILSLFCFYTNSLTSINEIYFPVFRCFNRPRTTTGNVVNNFTKIVIC